MGRSYKIRNLISTGGAASAGGIGEGTVSTENKPVSSNVGIYYICIVEPLNKGPAILSTIGRLSSRNALSRRSRNVLFPMIILGYIYKLSFLGGFTGTGGHYRWFHYIF